jgi:hypothetical protein
MKISPVGAEIFHTDRRTDRTKLIVHFLNFVNAIKITDEFVKHSSHVNAVLSL